MMVKARVAFSDEADKRVYVEECENDFEKRLDLAVAEIIADKDNRIITLSGPTCAGKTTTAKKIISEFEERGRHVKVVSIDDFYYDRDLLIQKAEKNGQKIDFDSVETIDLPLLKKTVDEIFAGGRVTFPRFDFKSGKRIKGDEFFCNENDIFLFEGIQAVYPEVTALFGEHPYVSVFISVFRSLEVAGVEYNPDQLRLLRRLVRDYNFRNATAEFTLNLWETVRVNEDKNILPNANKCKVLLDSLMPYEISMLKPYALPILRSVSEDSLYYDFAKKEIENFKHIENISKRYIPSNSLYREFLG